MDALSISALVISGLTALGGVIAGIHIKRMKSGCCESECFNPNKLNSPQSPSSPIDKEPTNKTLEI